MTALMKVFFGHLLELPADPGYFYLCPACYDELIEPVLPEVLERLRPPGTAPAPGDAAQPEPGREPMDGEESADEGGGATAPGADETV